MDNVYELFPLPNSLQFLKLRLPTELPSSFVGTLPTSLKALKLRGAVSFMVAKTFLWPNFFLHLPPSLRVLSLTALNLTLNDIQLWGNNPGNLVKLKLKRVIFTGDISPYLPRTIKLLKIKDFDLEKCRISSLQEFSHLVTLIWMPQSLGELPALPPTLKALIGEITLSQIPHLPKSIEFLKFEYLRHSTVEDFAPLPKLRYVLVVPHKRYIEPPKKFQVKSAKSLQQYFHFSFD
jgi:hypothetical protein